MADAKTERGDEHPSGLRDAIRAGSESWWRWVNGGECDDTDLRTQDDFIEASVVAWLSVVSEGEIEAAARAIWLSDLSDHHGVTHEAADCLARAALAASRGVLLPKETSRARTPGSSYSAGSPSMKEHP